ncbi:MAG: hypothetical protein KDD76_06685, partial [Rickettsiales bacterium]|nr:hypothetical protein [Rickettsiales bacterium]
DPNIKDIRLNSNGELVLDYAGKATRQMLGDALESGTEQALNKEGLAKTSVSKMRAGEEVHAQGIKGTNEEGGGGNPNAEQAVPLEGENRTQEIAVEREILIKQETYDLEETLRVQDALHDRQAIMKDAQSHNTFRQQQHLVNEAKMKGVDAPPLKALIEGGDIDLMKLGKAMERETDAPQVKPGKEISAKEIEQQQAQQDPRKHPDKSR